VPGVGPYTAAAVLSIAYGLPHAVVDGNVARVLARLRCLEPPEDSPRALATLAQALLDPRRPGDANQALMDLGAVVCLPRRPRCGDCPVASLCRSRSRGAQAEYPRPRRRAPAVAHRLRVYLLRDCGGRLLLERGSWTILPHLWLPLVREDGGGLPPRLVLAAPAELLGRFRHAITRHRIAFEVWGGSFRPGAGRLPRVLRLAGARDLLHIGRSSILEKALRCEGLRRDRIDAARRALRETRGQPRGDGEPRD
jgi:A/G-specific adenine glycosylase